MINVCNGDKHFEIIIIVYMSSPAFGEGKRENAVKIDIFSGPYNIGPYSESSISAIRAISRKLVEYWIFLIWETVAK